jgi:hypothetical protein
MAVGHDNDGEAREPQSAHGRRMGGQPIMRGLEEEEAQDLEALGRGRQRRRAPSGQRTAAERAHRLPLWLRSTVASLS